jgi:hypothetical protein
MFLNAQPMKRTRSPSVSRQVNRHEQWSKTFGDMRAFYMRAYFLRAFYMRAFPLARLSQLTLLTLLTSLAVMPARAAAENGPQSVTPRPIASTSTATPAEVLSFQEFFQTPIGPRGLALSDKTRSLQDQFVTLTGYRVKTDVPTVGWFLLAPLPNQVSPEEDGDANDLPANTVLVTLAPSSPSLPSLPSPLSHPSQKELSVLPMPMPMPMPMNGDSARMTLNGRFHWGAERAPDGQTYWFSLQLNEPLN